MRRLKTSHHMRTCTVCLSYFAIILFGIFVLDFFLRDTLFWDNGLIQIQRRKSPLKKVRAKGLIWCGCGLTSQPVVRCRYWLPFPEVIISPVISVLELITVNHLIFKILLISFIIWLTCLGVNSIRASARCFWWVPATEKWCFHLR